MTKLFHVMERLSHAGIHYRLDNYREGMVMIVASVPGRRVEIEISSSNELEMETFISNGDIVGENELNDFIGKFSETL